MKCQMIIPQKKELPKLQTHLRMLAAVRLFSALLVCSLVFLHSSFSKAGDGVDSNTITSGTTTSESSGTSTSTTVNNDDGSQTITETTPITTTTTTTTVTQTAVPNIIDNPTFTNNQGGGSSTNWNILACGGAGCAFSPSTGFKTSYGTGTIAQSGSIEDIENFNISQTEAGQGMTFSFGADVNNTRANIIGHNYSQGGVTDTWSIKLEVFNEGGTLLGDEAIGVTGGYNMGTTYQTNQTETGILNINAGNNIYSGTLTLSGIDNGYWGGFYGPSFNNVFTTFLYNEIETSITTSTTYSDLVTTVSCEILNTCPPPPQNELPPGVDIIQPTNPNNDAAILAPPPVEAIQALPSAGPSEQQSVQMAPVELTPPPIEVVSIEAPSMEIGPPVQMETQVANIEMELNNDLSSGESVEAPAPQSGGNITTPEPTTTSEPNVEPEQSAEEPKTESSTEPKPEPEVADAKSQDVASSDNKPEPKQPDAESKPEPEPKSATVQKQPAKKQEGKAKAVSVKKLNKPVSKKQAKRQAKQKSANKIVKNMGDKGKYEGGNQLKTLIVMQVLGNTKSFFSAQKILQDTPGFFTSTKIPDATISDNNYNQYFLFGGSDAAHNALIESQYRR